jgi:hypothetical protein
MSFHGFKTRTRYYLELWWFRQFSSAWLQTGRPGFDPRQRQRTFPLASVSRPALRFTQPPVQWVPGGPFTTYRATGFDPRQRQRTFSLASVSRPALRFTQPPVQWVPGGPFTTYRATGFDPRQKQRICPLAFVPRPVLRATWPLIQWVPGWKRRRSVTLTTHPHPVPRSGISRNNFLSTLSPAWRTRDSFYMQLPLL